MPLFAHGLEWMLVFGGVEHLMAFHEGVGCYAMLAVLTEQAGMGGLSYILLIGV